MVQSTIDNQTLLLIQSNFRFPSRRFLLNFTLDDLNQETTPSSRVQPLIYLEEVVFVQLSSF